MRKGPSGWKTGRIRRHASLTGLFALFFAFSAVASSCDYARMRDQESVRTYEKEMPEMDPRTVPVTNGYQALLAADPATLENPAGPTDSSAEQGRLAYGYFCIQCHGSDGKGRGTVGQSFSPLPTDLTSDQVQSQTDGALYAKIRLGFRRHPRLFDTVSEGDTWAVVDFLRSSVRSRARE